MKLIILSDVFYSNYGNYPEVLKKTDRPYYCISLRIEGHQFAIPLRHHINHAYAFKTIGEAGLDYTKAVLIDNEAFVSDENPTIDTREWRIIRSNADAIYKGFHKYYRQFIRALSKPNNPRSIRLIKYSALQYFKL